MVAWLPYPVNQGMYWCGFVFKLAMQKSFKKRRLYFELRIFKGLEIDDVFLIFTVAGNCKEPFVG